MSDESVLRESESEDAAEQSQREAAALSKLSQWRKENSAIANMGINELSLLKSMLAMSDQYRDQQFWMVLDFVDRDEAMDHVAAFYEAKEIGLDTTFNVAYACALVAANDKKNHSNRIAQLLDSLSHVRYTANVPKEHNNKGQPERSPLSSG